MAMQEHVDSLRSKHARLEQQIHDEMNRPLPDPAMLSRLKKEKLRIKEEIERSDVHLIALTVTRNARRLH
ncbi:hypothetical protein SAMN07250955_103335 [Arboricoccus pini]|uniref:DUF465 domain-containing protein n=1 Tax=Arboricoccus pini TaxID=1963835 RepID=A0A212QUQ8_9PROT|nr:DUF465 domain-containing protein [Arboricoccus pini]SNB63448.1 hypothetical protein SAMN07250955_103335 [Arboricoccus pini]